MPTSDKNNTLFEAFYHCLIVSFLWFWTNNSVLASYNLQLTAFFVIAYFIARFFLNKKADSSYSNLLLDVLVLTAVLLLVIASTGGLSSPIFFLIYFYLFAFALLFEPFSAITATVALALFFVKEINSLESGLQLFSLVLFSPLAIYFGRKYLELLQSQDKIKILAKKTKQLSTNNYQLTTNILDHETNALLWLSLDFKDSLLKIIHYTAEVLADANLKFNQKDSLQKIHETAKNILKSGEKLQNKIDRETD